MTKNTVFLLGVVVFFGAVLIRTPDPKPVDSFDEMGSVDISEKITLDPIQQKFLAAYRDPDDAETVIDEYRSKLSLESMLHALDSQPYCHGKAHPIGELIFETSQDLSSSLTVCGSKCTAGCFHGILLGVAKASRQNPVSDHFNLEEGKTLIADVCANRETIEHHRIGNCAHGAGHGFAVLSNYSIKDAVSACDAFEDKRLVYYCAAGVFMEYITQKPQALSGKPLDYLCSQYPRFPAACYRYEVDRAIREGMRKEVVVAFCESKDGLEELGCFHGLGRAYMGAIRNNPERLEEICGNGTVEDKIVCADAPIELISQIDEGRAHEACNSFTNAKAMKACHAAATRKIYSLEESFAYYIQ